jgi:GNAT superfamily N-acetyltransferase
MFTLFRHRPFNPIPLGPAWALSGSGRLTVKSGPLAGRTFDLVREILPHKADFYVKLDGDIIAHTHFDRDVETGLDIEWNIFVHRDFRGNGLSSLLVRLSYRRLLAEGRRHWFGMRKLLQVDTRHPELQNIGIGLISIRIGMRPESAAKTLLADGNVKSVDVLEASSTAPPGLLLHLDRLPGVIIAADIDPQTGKPYTEADHYRRFFSPATLLDNARAGTSILGNIDYYLARDNIDLFARHFADNDSEFRKFSRSLRAGSKKLAA